MKKFKSGILSLAIVLGVSGAVVSKIKAAPKVDADLYNWTRASGHTPISGEINPFNGKTVAEAQENYGCDGSTTRCATGVDPNGVLDDVPIFESQN